jgi:hypothetical protein
LAEATTTIFHLLDQSVAVAECQEPGCVQKIDVAYVANEAQINALKAVSTSCSQDMKVRAKI